VITAPISLIIGNQQDATFAFVSLAIVLCSFLSMGLIFVPKVSINSVQFNSICLFNETLIAPVCDYLHLQVR
jgi:hypothetical protein